MGSDIAKVEDEMPYSYSIKVHNSMCKELAKFVYRVICIIPVIESNHPGCRSGIQELCSLNTTVEKAKLLLQHCSEASKLYLAITGEATVLRCERIQNAINNSLTQIQNMVPQTLATQVAAILRDLREVTFVMESSEEEAGRQLLALLRQTKSTEIAESKTFQIAASNLHLTSSKACLIEKRAIRKLLDKVRNNDPKKESILNYFLYLLKKYGKSVGSGSFELCGEDQADLSSANVSPMKSIPETSCPWSTSHSGSIMNFGSSLNNVPPVLLNCRVAEYLMQSDCGSVSVASSDDTCMDLFQLKINEDDKGFSHIIFVSGDSQKCQTFAEFSHDTYLGFLSKVSAFPLVSQCKAVEDFKYFLKGNNGICHSMLNDGFLEILIRFLKDAHNMANMRALRSGAQILLAVLEISGNEIPSVTEDVFQLLACLLESGIIEESLGIIQFFSGDAEYKPKILASGVFLSVVKILCSQAADVTKHAVRILSDLSSHHDSRSYILTSECISKLVLLLGDSRFATCCVEILGNVCDAEVVKVAIAEADGCVASIVELLELGNHEEQEHAVAVLYSLCTYSTGYCFLVLQEGVIPPLESISVNGSIRAKGTAKKLLNLLRVLTDDDPSDVSVCQVESHHPADVESHHSSDVESQHPSDVESHQDSARYNEKKPTSKASMFFGRKKKFLF
ncbi:U-box domain-containing protein 5 [Acorus calamus]|uniref:U-box domain-containing protein 5 n=1 Tax=Acorus calamus TaxID=4465 RepID=A0AAV9FHK4_ACOCL|nr:U-box domain-containing protein 5 [Acorus calamus]